jgi:hypothetical protein
MPLIVRQEWKGHLVFPLFRRRARDRLARMAPDVEAFCLTVTPRDTGALQSTVTAYVPADGVRLILEAGGPAPGFGAYVVYAHLVHDGTDRMPPRPFITQTMNRFAGEFRSVVAASWNPFA